MHETTLEGGLRVVVSPIRGLPAVAVALALPGARAGAPATVGNSRDGEAIRLVRARGGWVETHASEDASLRAVVLPASEIALALWIQIEALPAAGIPAALGRKPASGGPAPVLAPVLTIAGDVDVDAALALALGLVRASRPRGGAIRGQPPLPKQEDREAAPADPAGPPRIDYRFTLPAGRSAELGALALAARIVAARALAKLGPRVPGRGLVGAVSGEIEARVGPGLLRIEAALEPGAKREEVRRVVEAELDAIGKFPPGVGEIERARLGLEADALAKLASAPGRAVVLAEGAAVFGDARALLRDLEVLSAVSPEAVRRAAAAHLGPARRSNAEVGPGEAGAEERR